jgi:hypothetical protein
LMGFGFFSSTVARADMWVLAVGWK